MKDISYEKFYKFHGVELTGDRNASGDCPFCEGKGKLSVRLADGLFNCFRCKIKGSGPTDFIRLLWDRFNKEEQSYDSLIKDRGLLYKETPEQWGIVWSSLKGQWCVPGYNLDGTIGQFYRYATVDGRKATICSSVNQKTKYNHRLFGVNLFNPECKTIYLCEGLWDGMVLRELLGSCKQVKGKLVHTSNPSISLLADANVLATPGCGVFYPNWCELFSGKRVILLNDNDYPINEKCAGYEGTLRTTSMLRSYKNPPSEILYLQWGKRSHRVDYDPELPNGFDIRDLIQSKRSTKGRLKIMEELLEEWIAEVPSEKISKSLKKLKQKVAPKENEEEEAVSVSPIDCTDYKQLINSWRKALKWTEGLDHALTVMLASVASTRSLGDQLWVKVIGPASCLDGDTMIYDPIDNSSISVRDRYKLGKRFWVYSRNSKGEVIRTQALPPQNLGKAMMYEVSFSSGKKICVTEKHKFWNGFDYVSLADIMDTISGLNLHGIGTYCISTISVTDIESHKDNILSESDDIVAIKKLEERDYYDFHVPETQNYWAEGFFHHNCGKSTLCEALSVSRSFIFSKSTIRGFHSGIRKDGEDCSLISLLNGKTLVIKDGDTLLQSPNLGQILSEARDLYDGTSRTHYRTGVSKDYEGQRITFILCGTNALHAIDSSELGERFLTCVIMDKIDDEQEDEVLWRVCNRAERNLSIEATDDAASSYEPALAEAMALTGGYVEYLRTNSSMSLAEITMDVNAKVLCTRLGKFTAYMRARPSTRQGETAEREFAARLVSQYVRLAKCLAYVLNKKTVDKEVLRRVRKVALDSARGQVLALTAYLFEEGENGLELRSLSMRLNKSSHQTQGLLRFLRAIGVIHAVQKNNRVKYHLTERIRNLYDEVMKIEEREE